MTNTVLVTGANGFLGNHIVRILLQRKFRVIALVRPGSDIRSLNGLDCTVRRGELHNPEDIGPLVMESDYVIHCASMTSPNSTNLDLYKKVNLASTELLVKACEKHNIRRFVLVSTANCFTNGTIEKPGNENSGFMPWLRHSGYAYSKYLAQEHVLQKNREENFPGIVVAPTFLVGPYDIKPSSGALLLYALKNKILFCPKGGKSFVDVRAVAIATANALTMGRTGECYLLSGANLSYKEYFIKIQELTLRRKQMILIPKQLENIFGVACRIFPHQKIRLLKTHMRMLSLDNYFNNTKAREELHMPDTDIDEAIKNSVNWFTEEGYLKK
ncbi:NAD-dependent epimerase/dehydratase family protein [Sinomicrobium sp. M5D2P17]